MLDLLTDLLPVMLYANLIAIYLGGWPVDLRGGNGVTQTIGLVIAGVLFWVVWEGLHRAFVGVGPVLGGIVITSFIAVALLPLTTWISFKLVGVTVTKVHAAH